MNKYEEIDAFSQGRHQSIKSDFSAKNMGKNDLWIAATASAFNITLVTTDRDFDHLDGVFIDLKFIEMKNYK
ncbi:MAG TPA: PIN domain-containing protein [Saprospiraceae bacterium]|nr:PIN domain-containing protein [Saprospiraceae bacterium]HMQ83932.1 PIN domain-containing protein [Saprospiraceae bacterium]